MFWRVIFFHRGVGGTCKREGLSNNCDGLPRHAQVPRPRLQEAPSHVPPQACHCFLSCHCTIPPIQLPLQPLTIPKKKRSVAPGPQERRSQALKEFQIALT